MSEHKNLAAALAAAQMEMGKALKQSSNPHFKSKYADLASVMDACLPALNKHGIAVIQPTVDDELGRYVETVFIHGPSGDTMKCRVPLIVSKQDMQGYGSAVTYARRYGLMGMAGIAPEDDDGNAAASAPPQPKEASWAETVIQDLPPDATPFDKADAIAKALCAQWQRKKTATQLENEWDRRAKLVESLEAKFPELHGHVIDAYEQQMMKVTGQD